MSRVELLATKIEKLRTDLNLVLTEDRELVDPEVIKASQSLDKVIIQYYRVLGMRGRRRLKEGMK